MAIDRLMRSLCTNYGLHLLDEMRTMLAEEPSNEIAGAGKQAPTVWTLAGAAFQEELGVLPITMASVTAAMIFAARMRTWNKFRRELHPNT